MNAPLLTSFPHSSRSKLFLQVRMGVVGVYLTLPFFDKPWWCTDKDYPYECRTGKYAPPTSGIPIGPLAITRSLEALCLLLFVTVAGLKAKSGEKAVAWLWAAAGVVWAAALGDCGYSLLTGEGLFFADVIRPGAVLAFSAKMRTCFSQFLSTLHATMQVLFLTLLHVSLFSYIGYILFSNTAEGLTSFPSLSESLWNLFILLTTTNYPDVMLPGYAESRGNSGFFVVFLVVGLFFLYRLLLAVVYGNYKKQVERRAEELMQETGWKAREGRGEWKGGRLFAITSSPFWEVSTSLISLLNLFSQLSEPLLEAFDPAYWVYLQLVFICLHIGESGVRAVAVGGKEFVRRVGNCLEIGLNMAVLGVTVYILSSRDFLTLQYLKYLTLLRLFRLLSLLSWIPAYRLIFTTFLRLLPVSGPLFGMVFLIFYCFATVGIRLFGGKVYRENEDVYGDVTIPPLYVYNNFNDLASGFITLWELLIVNNWWVIAQQFTDATSLYTRFFFLLFYLIAVVLGLNLLTTLVVDMFCTQLEEEKAVLAGNIEEKEAREEGEGGDVELMRRTIGQREVMEEWVRFTGERED